MTIDFGNIKNYNADRGFGFVGRTFFDPDRKVFFHIKKIKKKHPELAQKLDNKEAFNTVNFWYELETTEKGEQVSKLWLKADNIPQSYTHELCDLIEKVESIWRNVVSQKPSWLDLVTIDLVGNSRKHELSIERDNLEAQHKAVKEEQRKKAEALRQREITRIAEEHCLEETKAIELHQLITEMRPLGFTNSKQLSNYIVRHQLGYRYPNISGIVIMEDGGEEWEFPGGFPTKIYTIICRELNLDNQRTSARVKNFESFHEIYLRNQE
ncbi:cold shock domain-containing protein [Myxosarcina sp. GI1]|uniref:cold shock domain-containing protein n=1 Tax=Myxosarcina sp. GI1 TaxID=1541065 RepID=UPI00056369BA|nr:cold shock domain-containing protein [Myxosarcina sp. GI1]